MQPQVSIIYLCHGNLRHLPEVVSSFAAQTYPHDRMTVYMIPNGSPDGIADVIRKDVLPRSGADLPEIVLLDDGENRGFAGGNNQGMQLALDQGSDFVFLNNGDLYLHPEAIEEAVTLAQSDEKIGAVQSFVRFWNEHDKVNVTGGMIHVAGYGYARDNGKQVSEVQRENGEEIAYASGAAVLYRADALRKVGLLEEGFFMYHEDLELGLRLRFAGWKNVLSTKSQAYHDYSFSRNPKKFQWMETYRVIVLLAYSRFYTIGLLFFFWLAIDAAVVLMALQGGWITSKLKGTYALFLPKNIKLLFVMRARAQRLRVISDSEWLRFVTGRIEDQETPSKVVAFGNRIVDRIWKQLRAIITW